MLSFNGAEPQHWYLGCGQQVQDLLPVDLLPIRPAFLLINGAHKRRNVREKYEPLDVGLDIAYLGCGLGLGALTMHVCIGTSTRTITRSATWLPQR